MGELGDLESYIPSLRQILKPGKFEELARACDRGQWSKSLAGMAQNVARSILVQRLGRLRTPLQLQGQLAGAILRRWLDELQRECSRQSYDRGCGTYADERDAVARYLVHKFTLEGFKVYAEVNLAPAMAMRGVEGPSQPSIDVLLYDPRSGELHAIEVKYFRPGGGPGKYYAGIDEALALLAYGVDSAWLYHLFDKDFDDAACERQAAATERVLEATPLGYVALKLCSERFCAQRRPRPNPLLADPAAAAIRRVIMEEYAR